MEDDGQPDANAAQASPWANLPPVGNSFSPGPAAPLAPPVGPPPPAASPTAEAPGTAPMMAPPGSGPAAPTKSLTQKDSIYESSRTKVSPEEAKAQAELQRTMHAREDVERRAGAIGGQVADETVTAAEVKQKIVEQHGAKLEKIADDAGKEYAAHEAALKAADTAYKTATPTELFADDKTGRRKFWAGIATVLGGFGGAMTGTENPGLAMINDAVNRHDKTEQARIAKLRDVREGEKDALAGVLTKKSMALADLASWKASALDIAATQLETRLAQLGRPLAQIKTDENVLKLREGAEAERAAYLQVTRQTIKNQVVTRTQEIIGGTGAAAGGGRAAGKMFDTALLQAQMKDDVDVIKKYANDPKAEISLKAMARVQDNMTKMKAGDEAHGLMAPLLATFLRKHGQLPRSATEGLSTEQRLLFNSLTLLATKAAEQVAKDKDEREKVFRELMPSGSDPREVISQKVHNLLTMAGAAEASSGNFGKVADQGAAAVHAQVPLDHLGGVGETKQFTNKRTGQVETLRKGPDGKWYPAGEVAQR